MPKKSYEELLGFKKMQEISQERLHPPPSPNFEEGVKNLQKDDFSAPYTIASNVDFTAIAQASEFQRFVYWLLTGKTFRGSTQALKKEIQKVRQFPPEVMKELKEVLKKRNENK